MLSVLALFVFSACDSFNGSLGRFLERETGPVLTEFYQQAGAAGIPQAHPLPGGPWPGVCSVTLSAPTAGAAVYYTLDGTAPGGAQSLRYTGPVTVHMGTVLRAVALKENMEPSAVLTVHYRQAKPPVITQTLLDTGKIQVALSSPDGGSVFYTKNGTDPGPGSLLYTGPFSVEPGTAVKARTIMDGSKPKGAERVELKAYRHTYPCRPRSNERLRGVPPGIQFP